MTKYDQGWPSYLRQLMDSRGFKTGSDLARATGISDSVISRWLKGLTAPDVDNLRRLAKPTGVQLLDLMVAAGVIDQKEARLKDAPKPPPVPVGANVDPEVLAALADADPAAIEAVRAVLRATKR